MDVTTTLPSSPEDFANQAAHASPRAACFFGAASCERLLLITAYMTIGMGIFSLVFVIPAVVFAIVSIIAIALVSLFRKDTAYARNQFRQLVEFYRKHRMYQ